MTVTAPKGLRAQLDAAEAEVERLKHQIGGATCAEIGECDWICTGGANAGCDDRCACSVPVHVCSRCGDCDYGKNADADRVLRDCANDKALVAINAHD